MTKLNELSSIFEQEDIDETLPQNMGILLNIEDWYENVYKPYMSSSRNTVNINSELAPEEIDKDILFQEIEKSGIEYFMQGPVGIFDYKAITAESVKLETLDLSNFKILYSS